MREVRAFAMIALLAGCTLAPKHVRPEAPIDARYPELPAGTSDAGTGPSVSETGWASYYQDPRLQELIRRGLASNRDVRRVALDIEAARSLLRIQRSELLPGVQATAGATYSQTSAAASPVGQGFRIEQYQVGLAIPSFELDLFGRIRSLTRAQLARYLASEEAWRAARVALIGQIAATHLAERAADEQLELARQALETREQALELARQRFEAGVSSEIDFRQAQTLVESARVSVASLTRQRAQAENALRRLVGAPVDGLPEPRPLGEPGVVTDIPAGLPSDLLTQRPDIRAAEQRLRAANADVGAARAAFLPRIGLTGSVGTASGELTGLFGPGTAVWSFVPQIVQPIFQWGRNRANLRLSEVRKEQAIVDYEIAIQTAFREVADALVARATFVDQVAAQERLVEAQSVRLELAEQRYDNGVASYLEVLDAQRDLFAAEQGLVQARQASLTNAVDLYRALGGGFSGEEEAP